MRNKDKMFSNMLHAALERFAHQDPWQISRLGNVPFNGNAFCFESLGQRITVAYPDYQISPQLDQWHSLTILHYLASADGTELTNNPISFSQHQDGMVRGGGFDREAEQFIQTRLGLLSPEALEKRCLALGAELIPSNADLCAKFYFLPNYPVWLKIWFADEEFPASGRLLLDQSAEHYLSIEDAVTVGSLILHKLLP